MEETWKDCGHPKDDEGPFCIRCWCKTHGWTYNEGDKTLTPPPIVPLGPSGPTQRQQVEELRNTAHCGLSEAKRALHLMGDDMAIAINYLRQHGQAVVRRFTGTPIQPHNTIFTLREFIIDCKQGCLIDYDGYGYYAKDGQRSDITVRPSDVTKHPERIDTWFTHIVWYNR